MKLPIAHLTLFDYHYVSDIVDNKIGKRIKVPQSMIFELEPELKGDTFTEQKFGYCKSTFELLVYRGLINTLSKGLPRSTMYLLTSCFFYDLIKDYDEDTVSDWRYEFDVGVDVYSYLIKKIEPFINDNETRNKVNRVMQQSLDRFISRVGLLIEQERESAHTGEGIYNEDAIQTGSERMVSLPRRRSNTDLVTSTFFITILTSDTNINSDSYIMLDDGIGMNFVVCDTSQNNESNSVSCITFKGYYSYFNTYNRGDSVIYNLSYFVCLKKETVAEDVVNSEYWFKMPHHYNKDYTPNIQCSPDDYLCIIQLNCMNISHQFDNSVSDI